MPFNNVTAVDYIQNFNIENELDSVVNNGSTTTFAYDAASIRTKTVSPSNVTTYYPFPGYEEEVNGSTTTRRITYSAAGQAIALRVQIVSGSNTLYYLHSDHLGSTSLMTNSTNGNVIANTASRYYPFGGWRTEPTANLTDRGFTGHLHNNLGSGTDDIGLVYMQARWFLPGVGRFISADTLIPDPTDPQSYNRYSYVRNQPLTRIDPTGHKDELGLGGGGGGAGAGGALSAMIQKAVNPETVTTITTVATIASADGDSTNEATMVANSVSNVVQAVTADGDLTSETRLGLNALSRVSEFGIDTYNKLRTAVTAAGEKGLQVHHLIEQRFAKAGTINVTPAQMQSVVVTPEEHQVFTNAWRTTIPYVNSGNMINTVTATADDIWAAAQKVYGNNSVLLEKAFEDIFK